MFQCSLRGIFCGVLFAAVILAVARYWNWFVAIGVLGASTSVVLHLLATRLGHASIAIGNAMAAEEKKQGRNTFRINISLAENSVPENTTCRIHDCWWILLPCGFSGLVVSFLALHTRGELNLHPLTLGAVSFAGALLGVAGGLIVVCLKFVTAHIVAEFRRN